MISPRPSPYGLPREHGVIRAENRYKGSPPPRVGDRNALSPPDPYFTTEMITTTHTQHSPGQDVTRLAGKTVRSSYYPRTLCGVRGRDHARTRSMETTNQRLTPRPVRRTQTRLARRGANWRSSVQAFRRGYREMPPAAPLRRGGVLGLRDGTRQSGPGEE